MYKVKIDLNNNNSSNQSISQHVTDSQSNDSFPLAQCDKDTLKEIANLLSWKDIVALKQVSKFFNHNLDYHVLKHGFNQLLKETMIITGHRSTLVLTPHGNVYGCGNNSVGQLGFDDTNKRLVPEKLPFRSVAKVAAGFSTTFFQLKDGRILGCGCNTYGELGLKKHNIVTLKKLSLPSDMNIKNIQIIAGFFSSFIISEEGKIWGAGSNYWGQLGLKNKNNHYTFTTLPIEGVKQVISNGSHTFFLKDKEIWGCGSNDENQMELEDPLQKKVLVIQKLSSKPIKKIISGSAHTIIQKEDGIWGCGSNEYGQLGLGENIKQSKLVKLPIESVREIFAEHNTTFFLLENGQVWACGENNSGELGLGNKDSNVYQPTLLSLPIELNQVVDIIAGTNHSLFLLKDGRILGCGSNDAGQLGLGPIQEALTPRELPQLTKCLGLHALYKKIEALNPANANKNSNQKSEKSNAESNSSEFQNNNNNYKP